MEALVKLAKQFARIDYEDDDELVKIMVEAMLTSMEERIPGFDREKPTGRQKLLLLKGVKSLYDQRDAIGRDPGAVTAATVSMLLSERYEGLAKQLTVDS